MKIPDHVNNINYGLGNYFLGAWIGKSKIENEYQRYMKLNFYPFIFMFIIDNVSSCIRIHIFNYIKVSLAIEIE